MTTESTAGYWSIASIISPLAGIPCDLIGSTKVLEPIWMSRHRLQNPIRTPKLPKFQPQTCSIHCVPLVFKDRGLVCLIFKFSILLKLEPSPISIWVFARARKWWGFASMVTLMLRKPGDTGLIWLLTTAAAYGLTLP